MLVTYSSNNSGGNWWLSDDDWRALEAAGWSVKWRPERWFGALATEATREAASVWAAQEEWRDIVGQDPDDEGCRCCGAPHWFSGSNKDEDVQPANDECRDEGDDMKKMTRKNADRVLARMTDMIRNDTGGLSKTLLYHLNEMLDGMVDSDAFGTEGQLDPRGDNRND